MGHVSQALNKSRGEQRTQPGKPTAPQTQPDGALAKREPLSTVDAKSVAYSSSLVVWRDPTGRTCEQYRSLRSHLLAYFQDKPFSLIVTSAQSGEGKTVTTLNLAFVLSALRECRTVVVDCDFRRNGVARQLRDQSEVGLAQVLRGDATVKDVIRLTPLPNLSVILAGKTSCEQVGGLVARPELDDLARQLRRNYDYVLFDTPPVNTLSDAGVVGRAVGQALMVVRAGRTRRESVKEAIRHLRAVSVKIAGLVLVRKKYYIPSYLYRYS